MNNAFDLPPLERERLLTAGPRSNETPQAKQTRRGPAPADTPLMSKRRLWSGRIISGLAVGFLLFDSIPKILALSWVVKASTALGFPANAITPIGLVLLLCTCLYCIPRTAILGAILLTGYLGGAVESNVHIGAPLFSNVLFPIYFAVFVWGGLALRDRRIWRIFERSGR